MFFVGCLDVSVILFIITIIIIIFIVKFSCCIHSLSVAKQLYYLRPFGLYHSRALY